jgi:hypothetical protein
VLGWWLLIGALVLWQVLKRSSAGDGSTSLVERLGNAIAQMEGFYPGTRAWRNNNPGNLRDYRKDSGQWAIWPELPHDSAGFPQFPSATEGWNAMYRDLGLKIARGLNLEQLISAWAPPSDGNDTASYVRFVAGRLGIPSDVPLQELS